MRLLYVIHAAHPNEVVAAMRETLTRQCDCRSDGLNKSRFESGANFFRKPESQNNSVADVHVVGIVCSHSHSRYCIREQQDVAAHAVVNGSLIAMQRTANISRTVSTGKFSRSQEAT